MLLALTMLSIICSIAALTFIVRLVCAPFSEKVSEEMRGHPVIHWILGSFAFLVVLMFLGVLNPMFLNPMWWPPRSVERRGQRQKVLERVNSADGWAAIQRDCDTLVAQYPDTEFYWYRHATNSLPPALAALNPWDVRFYSPTMLRNNTNEPQVVVVQIKVFGMHSTGGHSTPYFGLEVVSGKGAETYRPMPSRGGVSGNGYRSYTPVTDRIYEIY